MASALMVSAFIATTAVAAPSPARADATLEEAKRVAKQASMHYQLARFTEANDAYAKSYELVPTAGLLFNLGQCQMMLKNYTRALFFFEGYLRDKPDAPNAALVRDLITEARKELAAQQAAENAEKAARLAALVHVDPPPPAPASPPPGDRRRVPAVALGAASLALLNASLDLGMHSDTSNLLSRLAAANSAERATYDSDRKSYAIAAGVTGGLALGAAVSSGVLGYLGWRRARTPVTVTPAVSPTANGGAATLSGTF